MPSLGGLKRRVKKMRPHVQSAFIVFVTARESPAASSAVDDFEVREVTSAHDPLLDEICPKWQRPWAEAALKDGTLDIIVALKDGKLVGRIWEKRGNVEDRFSGVPRVKLAPDEFFMFDLFVTREYRRSNIGMTMADYFFKKYNPQNPDNPAYGYGFVSYENAASIMWHYSIGFNIAQTINYLSIGDRIKWKIPFSDVPRFGPMSRKGRYNTPDADIFGTALFPNL